MKNKQKGSVGVISLVIIVAIILGGGLYIYFQKEKSPKPIENTNTSTSTPSTKSTAVVEDVWEYGELSYFRDGNDLYLLNYFQFENEYSGWTYHINLETNQVHQINSPIILKENGKIIGARAFVVDGEEKYDKNNKFDGYVYNDAQLEQISKETGIAKKDLELIARGGKPVFNVLVKAEYNPSLNKLILTKEQVSFPTMNNINYLFEWNGKVYPGSEFTKVGIVHDLNGAVVIKSGIEFNYNAATDKLTVSY
jgi:hypothetical protein